MARNLFSRIKRWLAAPEVKFENSLVLKDITQNTINELVAAISYNKKVVVLAYLSLAIWAALLICYCFCTGACNTFFDVEIYPAPLWALITGAFNENERLERKKKLNEIIKQHADETANPLHKELTSTAWDEYKSL